MSDDEEEVCGAASSEDSLPYGVDPIECDIEPIENGEKCIFHADPEDENKNIDQLSAKWENIGEEIHGLNLSGMSIGDALDFSSKKLHNANFSDAQLNQADFRGSDLYNSDFTGAKLRSAKFHHPRTDLERAVFDESKCIDTRFMGAKLHNVDFKNANASSAKFQHSDLADATLDGTNFRRAKFIRANLRSAEFVDADLYKAECGGANFEDAILYKADIRSTSFVGADMYGVDFRNVVADHQTDFGKQTCREYTADHDVEWNFIDNQFSKPAVSCDNRGPLVDLDEDYEFESEYNCKMESYWENLGMLEKFIRGSSRALSRFPLWSRQDSKRLEESEEIYSDLKHVFQISTVSESQRHYNIRQKEIKRKLSYTTAKLSWFRLSLTRRTMKHGESPLQVLISAIFIIGFFSLVYPISGLRADPGNQIFYTLKEPISISQAPTVLYFSVRRLITASNGGITPLGLNEGIALAETIAGALLTAMLSFVLGRRATS
ncbi:pentapeptide repeat-containing protein [Haloarchaeobius sp. DYHT-AS-18]|uniref:pentapeptide repeat-containing protein n=1 Tax=Haloarchaeobius sp. DYHT-AS-18 TaxID=3446117 RepID=UPI003EB7954D